MSRLPGLTFQEIRRGLERGGFVLVRTRGSHHFFQHSADPRRYAVVPFHRGTLPTGTVREIIRSAGFSVEEFLALM